jgi:hypothetical protein
MATATKQTTYTFVCTLVQNGEVVSRYQHTVYADIGGAGNGIMAIKDDLAERGPKWFLRKENYDAKFSYAKFTNEDGSLEWHWHFKGRGMQGLCDQCGAPFALKHDDICESCKTLTEISAADEALSFDD